MTKISTFKCKLQVANRNPLVSPLLLYFGIRNVYMRVDEPKRSKYALTVYLNMSYFHVLVVAEERT